MYNLFRKLIMTTFNLTSYENGRIIKIIKARNYLDAENFCYRNGYDLDDYFLESEEARGIHDSMPGITIYIDEEL